MATEQAPMSLNGTYAAHQGQVYGAADQNYASHNANAASYTAAQQPTSTPQSTSSNGAADIPKDEVGWYFVEQYYTTLSRTPEKLFLFYNKRSQFVSGVEEEKVEVCVGQKAINDRIKELDFKDCKVRVTNVDSQGSDSNIVIQVIGEISNKNQPHRKFTQTFVLAAQTNGYFVLNDIFRYIKEEEEEVPEEEIVQETAAAPAGYQEPAPSAQEPVAEVPAHEVVANEEEVAQVDNKLEEIQKEETERTASPPPAQVNGTPVPEAAEVAPAEDAPAAAAGAAEVPTPEQAATEVAEEAAQPEKPEDPTPTPAPEPAKAAPAPTPATPAKPMSWAMKAASANKSVAPAVPAVPAVPAQSTAPKAAQAQTKPAPTAAAPAATAAAAAAPAAAAPAAREESPADNQQDGWQTAEHTKRQSRAQNQPSESTSVRAYIKNVYENIDADALKAILSKFDKITYFDISRPKNAAFVEFATQEGFNAAVAANPHAINGTTIYVEERRQPGGQFQRYPSRGGSISRGRGGSDNRPGQGRGGFSKDGGRGGFTPRGRGGASTPRRGGSGAA